jgi:predicted small secreted protein
MKKINIFLLMAILGVLAILLTSCETVAVYKKPGFGRPPAHAPAHGLRKKQAHTVVVVDVE